MHQHAPDQCRAWPMIALPRDRAVPRSHPGGGDAAQLQGQGDHALADEGLEVTGLEFYDEAKVKAALGERDGSGRGG
ncbi:MAG: hypothetical protein R2699_09230 [Acidimicrobiales bacterium]